ncbi:MiaB/RimO family radical SAM methylthiotransferase [Pelodictyon luteolum]|uniref:MiaB-like tRNA modifying enzyme n=1 Tax=Chlorobium luteolum (strain DSM 273 / BCRC 81028 / 2530) TaxID=319225 RepID=Q3B249_CHLL3|nr:MiaB/RimO family radical SAM methylthiotransferase [Pelodictyon luteolum]ABB24582.1 MiaB-like tRNA modifying enzyme [Pelodictyon luteolum DSM 273]
MCNKKVAAVTLGCKLNYAESSSILQGLVEGGWVACGPEEGADLLIVHTCAVTGQAEQKCRQKIRQLIRRNPECRVAVIGCYAQLSPEVLGGIEGVDAVFGNKEKFDLDRYLAVAKGGRSALPAVAAGSVSRLQTASPGCSPPAGSGRTRAFLKIQDGCDYLCAYCTIPLARGRSRSIEPEDVLRQAHRLAGSGYREIVLSGVNTGDYRSGGVDFPALLRMLEEVPVSRIRISSLEPDMLSPAFLQVVGSSARIVPHFHLPLQSGSDPVLRAMRRRYTAEGYRRAVHALREVLPGCAVGADVMVGYPGEEEEDFQAMYGFIEQLPLSYLHVFSCSVRPGTLLGRQVAGGERLRVNPKETARRSALLVELGERKAREFALSRIGSRQMVLFEEGYGGYTPEYLRVVVEPPDGGEPLAGKELPVHVEGLGEGLQLHARLLS